MAWDDDRHWIPVVRQTNGAKSLRPADRSGDVSVSSSLTIGNSHKRVPACQLKLGPTQVEWKGEIAAIAGEILFQFANVRRHLALRWLESSGSVLSTQIPRIGPDRLLAGQSGIKLKRHQATTGGGQEQWPYRRSKYSGMKRFHLDLPSDQTLLPADSGAIHNSTLGPFRYLLSWKLD